MKRITVILLMLISMAAYSQTNYKWEAQSFKLKSISESWTSVEWKDTPDILISLTVKEDNNGRGELKIYSESTQEYTLIYASEVTEDMDKGLSKERSKIEWKAIDQDGVECYIRLINYTDDYWSDLIVILYTDWQWSYTINSI